MKLKLFIIFYFIFSFASISELIAHLNNGNKLNGIVNYNYEDHIKYKIIVTVEKEPRHKKILIKGGFYLLELKYEELKDGTFRFTQKKGEVIHDGNTYQFKISEIFYSVQENQITLFYFSRGVSTHIIIFFESKKFEVPSRAYILPLLHSVLTSWLTHYQVTNENSNYFKKEPNLHNGIYKSTDDEYFQVIFKKTKKLTLKNPSENISEYNNQNLDNDTCNKLFSGFVENHGSVIPVLEKVDDIQKLYTEVMNEEKSFCVRGTSCYHQSLEILSKIKNKGELPQPLIITLICPSNAEGVALECLDRPKTNEKWITHQALLYKAKDDKKFYVLDPSVDLEKIIELNAWLKILNSPPYLFFTITWKKY